MDTVLLNKRSPIIPQHPLITSPLHRYQQNKQNSPNQLPVSSPPPTFNSSPLPLQSRGGRKELKIEAPLDTLIDLRAPSSPAHAKNMLRFHGAEQTRNIGQNGVK